MTKTRSVQRGHCWRTKLQEPYFFPPNARPVLVKVNLVEAHISHTKWATSFVRSLSQGGPPCHSPAWSPGPRQGWAAGSDRLWPLITPRCSDFFSTSCGPRFSGSGYLTQCIASTSCPRSGRFWLRELPVSRTFPDFFRASFPGHGYPVRRAARAAAPTIHRDRAQRFEKAG